MYDDDVKRSIRNDKSRSSESRRPRMRPVSIEPFRHYNKLSSFINIIFCYYYHRYYFVLVLIFLSRLYRRYTITPSAEVHPEDLDGQGRVSDGIFA